MLAHGILDISMYQIKLFLALAEERNFTRVSVLFHITQPTLSKRISQLEQSLNMQLFIRKSRPIQLTTEGQALYTGWKGLHQHFEDAITEAEQCRYQRLNRLVVASPDSGNHLIALPQASKLMLDRFPEMEISMRYLSFSDWRGKVLSGEVDVMLTSLFETEELDEQFAWQMIRPFPKGVCMLRGNPLASRSEIQLEELKNARFVMNSPTESPEYTRFVHKICQEHGFSPIVARYAPNPSNLLNSLHYEDEVTVCDLLLRDIDNPLYAFVPLAGIESALVAVWRTGNHSHYLQPLLELLEVHHRDLEERVAK
ncbi:MAG: LysR family transcriptional regulator [Oscillospiraceae bacterium]|nr:LysR family transcriptional regulator [Oscillospiraceae bacterium]